MSMPLEHYGLIGDCQTAALVGLDGSIDWLCWPRFDSDACFAALLGDASHGCWRIAPTTGPVVVSRRYRPGSLILETSFRTTDGAVTLIDFMQPRDDASDLMRIVRGDEGETAMELEFRPRFGYGATTPWLSWLDDRTMCAVAGPDMLVLRSPVEGRIEGSALRASFSVRRGESIAFDLSYGPSHLPPPPPADCRDALAESERFWCGWTADTQTGGPYEEAIRRSLITLKALTYAPTGGIVAAPTTSLPERAGGERNWDYRFCWIRDSTLTLLALMNAGVYDEAAAWRDWLHRAVAGSASQMQIMYGIMGERRLTEWEVDWLPGYLDSRPVRIGNDAHRQFQLDVYGELMDTFAQARKGGLTSTRSGWALQVGLVEHVEREWRNPDFGIWEIRGPPRHFTFSKVMAWVVFDRAIKATEEYGLPGNVDAWRRSRTEIRDDIHANAFDGPRGTFRAAYDLNSLDASLLLMAQVGFIDARDSRYLGTVAAIERELVTDGFVRRYNTAEIDDGLRPGEGCFLACSFWLADAYCSTGRWNEGRALFDRLLSIRNDLGLLAEEYDPAARRQIGNFPQAFSHVCLINTAFNLTRAARPADQRARCDGTGVHASRAPRTPGRPGGGPRMAAPLSRTPDDEP
ncbi:MAG: glycoside hydrolase family 15 protein [Alphaproteobacteria bacterium]|nr:glycoside hydrolase family 15 protein [Alphaproteobacteria bacterium]MCW5744537.1 glycoside hydrolase family 15 protein [Alphaproteobacteria bacterium]